MGAPRAIQHLKATYTFLKTPIIISAPMRVFAGPDLAVATSRAGGLGFIGPGLRPTDLDSKLERARGLLHQTSITAHNPTSSKAPDIDHLPIGVGFQLFDGDLEVAAATVHKYKPVAAWLFVPASGQCDLDQWILRIRKESPSTKIWIQIGSVAEAVAAAKSKHAPDVLVVQGIDAGGHGLRKGAGVISLLPEIADALQKLGSEIPLVGAGGIADGRGVAAVLATGVAAGAVMGTRFLASNEADIKKGYQEDVLQVSDGGQSTIRTDLFDRLQGRDDWPACYNGRAIINGSVRDDLSGMDFKQNKQMFQEQMKNGSIGWGEDGRMTAYVGSAVGLVRAIDSAGEIIERSRAEARQALQQALDGLEV